MVHAKRRWSIWQALLSAFAWAFTGPSFRGFAEWVTEAINGEAHTITQSVLALDGPLTGRRRNPSPSTAPGTPTTSPPA